MLSKNMKNISGLLVVSCLLAACSDDDHAAEEAYDGKLTDAVISVDNAGQFPRSAFAARDYAVSSSAIETWLAGAAGADTINCAAGGKVAISRDIDAATMLGSKTLIFSENCTVDGVSLNGAMTQEVTAYDMQQGKATAVNIAYHKLEQVKEGKSVKLTGTLSATQDMVAKTVNLHIYTRMKADTGEEVLTNMQVAVTGNMEDRSASSTYGGKVCLKDEGCAHLSTTTPFKMDYNGYAVSGEMLASGADDTQVRVVAQDDSAFVKVALVE